MVVDGNGSANDGSWLAVQVLRADPDAWKTLVPTFASWLQDKDPLVRSRAAEMLGSLGPLAKATIPVLEPLYQHAGAAERIAIARAILRIDPGRQAQILRDMKMLVDNPALDRVNRTEAARLVRSYELGGRPIVNVGAAAKSVAN